MGASLLTLAKSIYYPRKYISRCCFIEQYFIIFRTFPLSKSFLSCQNTKEAEKGIDEARYYCMPYQIFKFI